MGDRFKKVQSGQQLQISAEVWNALIDLTREAKQQRHDQTGESHSQTRQTNLAKIRNQTGADFERFSIVSLASPVITPSDNELEFKNQTSFQATLPDVSTGRRFGVTLEPIPAGRIGTASVAGVVAARVAVGATIYESAEPIPGEANYLRNVPHGPASLLWIEASGSVRWAIIRFNDSNYEEIVYITSNLPDESGYYPGLVQRFDPVTRGWLSQFDCKVVDANQ